MPRISRAVAVGYPHHITQRGNYRQTVFKSDEDFNRYFQWLKKYSDKYSLEIWAYCLMSNHVHYVAVPMNDDSLSKTFNALHMMYSRYFNQKSGGNGHLWQGRFFSCVLDESHVYAAVRYVDSVGKPLNETNLYLYTDSVGKPISLRTNLYQYASNNPVNRIDPYGLFDLGQFVTGALSTAEGISTMAVTPTAGVLTYAATQNPWLTATVVVETSPSLWAGWTKIKTGWEDMQNAFKNKCN